MINKNNRNSRDDKSKSGNRKSDGRKNTTSSSSRRVEDKDSKFKKSSDFKEGFKSKGDNKDFKSKSFGDKKEFKPRTDRSFKPKNEETKSFKFGNREFKSKDADARTEERSFKPRTSGSRDFKPKGDRDFKPRGERDFKPKGDRDFKPKGDRDFKPKGDRDFKSKTNKYDSFKPSAGSSRNVRPKDERDTRPFRNREEQKQPRDLEFNREERTVIAPGKKSNEDKGLIRLNRYISNAGICSRRKADELIAAGVVTVNGEAVTELGLKVDPAKDLVRYNGELLKREKKVYVLLNKPKDYITTTDDPQERRTVMQLVDKASRERIYPVGRLDRNTTGLLLMTNDGDLADKLSHPKNGITKIYNVELNKGLTQGDLNKIAFGLELEDGLIKPDNISYVAGGSKKEIGIQIHSGKNRIVRRIFEHLGYSVEKLDRVVYGNLTKKDLPRGRWRYLEEHELIQIKHLIK
ncbi:pseudouridine synthase [Pedobacter sp. MW01-1-1]|uniref:pseudouridine synthase n=1 Tax=Pedobacter sp. MW01-1-1 TaxID=3383027 RepID=UPI003FF00C54